MSAHTLAAVAVAAASAVAMAALSQPRHAVAPTVRLYSSDPEHLWNRLHAALFVRTADNGREYGADRVDPLLWNGSTYLLQGPRHDEALARLDEFVSGHGERLIRDPLHRAILQRDLWAVFDWLQGSHVPYRRPDLTADVIGRAVGELSRPLATAIARLALSDDEIRSLPDNYRASSGTAALPADLFGPESGWVSVGRSDGPIAAQHVRDDGPGKNSVFFVMIRLPGGRETTVTFIGSLAAFSGPLWVRDAAASPRSEDYPNPALPAFPVGTQVALVRRALLVDAAGRVVPTHLTEQVQLRTYREIRPMTAQEFLYAHAIDENMFARAGQDFEEFSLSRAALFAGRGGGLLPLDAIDRFFLTFSSQGVDAFEMRSSRPEEGLDAAHARRVCKDCHAAPGVYSFNSYVPFRLGGRGITTPPRLAPVSVADAERTAVRWKEQRSDWAAWQARRRP